MIRRSKQEWENTHMTLPEDPPMIYLVCRRYDDIRPRDGEKVVTKVEDLKNVPDGFDFIFITTPSLELWEHIAEHGGKAVRR